MKKIIAAIVVVLLVALAVAVPVAASTTSTNGSQAGVNNPEDIKGACEGHA